jgi:hypothetical protein
MLCLNGKLCFASSAARKRHVQIRQSNDGQSAKHIVFDAKSARDASLQKEVKLFLHWGNNECLHVCLLANGWSYTCQTTLMQAQ